MGNSAALPFPHTARAGGTWWMYNGATHVSIAATMGPQEPGGDWIRQSSFAAMAERKASRIPAIRRLLFPHGFLGLRIRTARRINGFDLFRGSLLGIVDSVGGGRDDRHLLTQTKSCRDGTNRGCRGESTRGADRGRR
jgi:hypothetical protein